MIELTEIIKFGKYTGETLEILLKDINYTQWLIENATKIDNDILDTLKYYNEKNMKVKLTGGSLTERIKSLIENRNYKDIISKIPNINETFKIKKTIISENCNNLIKKIHEIHPTGCGCFIDYLFRIIISKFLNIKFYDTRALSLYDALKHDNKIKLMSYKKYEDIIEYDKYIKILKEVDAHNIDYYELIDIKDKTFKEYLNNNEYYEIYENYENINNNHQCNLILFNIDDYDFPISYVDAYEKVTNNEIDIKNLIEEIYIVSCAHCIYFKNHDHEKSLIQYEYISKNKNKFKNKYIDQFVDIIKKFNGKKYSLDPELGDYGISSDCDLIIDNNLIDFKVTKNNNDKYELLQLLGYSALINVSGHIIKEINIIDLYKNELKSIDIDKWTNKDRNNFLKYLQIDVPKKTKKIEKIKFTEK
jgi:hypothetical protein